MVSAQRYQRPLNGQARLQSGLGRVQEVYKESADTLIMAEVVKVNFVYNTVDVVSIKSKERIVMDNDTNGKFSAKLPVSFGGSLSNGMSYGQTIPVNVGDMVLIGFLQKDKTNPIVIAVYKSSAVASELAPTDRVAGNPEDPDLFNDVFSRFTLFPGQTYTYVGGNGDVEATFPGKSFLKIGTGLFGGGRLNDYKFRYTELSHWRLRGRDVYPLNDELPQIMFQHTGGARGLVTNVLFDDDGTLTLSKTNASDTARTDFQMIDNSNIKLRYQNDSQKKNDDASSTWSEMGIKDGSPFMGNNKHNVTLDPDKGFMIDGVPASDFILESGGDVNEAINALQGAVKDIQDKLDNFTSSEFDELKKQLSSLQSYINEDVVPVVNGVSDTKTAINKLQDQVEINKKSIDNIGGWISDAQGDDSSLQARLNRMETFAKSLKILADDVLASRTDNNSKIVFGTLGARLDSLSADIFFLKNLTSDYLKIKGIVNDLVTRVGNFEDDLHTLKSKLDVFLTGDFDDDTKQYVATIEADGPTAFRNGKGSTTLRAKLYRFGFDWTDLVTDNGFVWTRTSNDSSSDKVWNDAHSKGSKTLTVTADDFAYSASFSVHVTVDNNIQTTK